VNSWVLDNEWNIMVNCVFFNFVDGELTNIGDFVWNLNLGSVWNLVLNYEWLLKGDSEELLVPLSNGEFLFNVVCLFFILSHWYLLACDEWHLLDDSVVNSLGDIVGHFKFFLIGDLIVDSVWDLLCGDEWNLVSNGVGYLSAGDVGNFEFDLEWHLSINSIRHLTFDCKWLKRLNIVCFLGVCSNGDLVWDFSDVNLWDLLGDFVRLTHIVGDWVSVVVIGGVVGLVTILGVITASAVSVSVSMSMSSWCWVGFFSITRVIGVEASLISLHWDVSGPGFVLGDVGNVFLISVGCFVGDEWNVSVLLSDDCSVLGVSLSVVSGFALSSILGLVLNSVLRVEDGVVASLLFFPVANIVLIGIPCLGFISVLSFRVGSGEGLKLSSVPVFFLLSVLNGVVSLISGEWHISVVGLLIGAVFGSWLEGVSAVLVWSVLDLVVGGVPHLLVSSVLGLRLAELGGDRDLSGPDFLLVLVINGVLDLIVMDFDVTEPGLLTILGMGVFVRTISELDGCGGCKDEC